ncbi:MAG: hypothetical protein EPN17_15310 [Methylobacter sp.]|nr:MAG: hypothetical protein EPN17_15310 [Methylobacter sp.]
MNQTTQVNEILNSIAKLSLDDQGYIVDIVNHRFHEMQRNRLIDRTEEAELALTQSKVTTGSVNDFFAALEND